MRLPRSFSRIPPILAVVLVVGLPAVALAASWPQFQGDAAHSGSAAGPAPPYLTAWETSVPPGGPGSRFGLSAPVIVDGLAVAAGPEAIVAVNAETGEVEWSHERELGPSVPVAVVGSGAGAVLLFTEGWGDGPPVDPAATPSAVTSPSAASPSAASPSAAPSAEPGDEADEDTFDGPSRLVAVGWPDREPLWSLDLPQVSRSGVTVEGDVAYVGTNDGTVTAVQVATGSLRWAVDVGQGLDEAIAASADLVLVSVRGTRTDPALVVGLSADDGGEVWRYAPETASLIAGPAAMDDAAAYVGFSDGTVHAVDLGSGDERWSAPLNAAAPWAPPALADGTVYVVDVAGQLYALDAATGERDWDHPLNTSVFYPAPVVVADAVLIGTIDGDVVAFDRTSGDLIWRGDVGAGSVRAIASDGATLVVVRGGAGSGAVGLANDPNGVLLDELSPTVVRPGVLLGTWAAVAVAVCGASYLLGRLLAARLGPADLPDPDPVMPDDEEDEA